jgi:[citrate (pro-3S)-lyase] ligase
MTRGAESCYAGGFGMGAEHFGWEERILVSSKEIAERNALLISRGLNVPENEALIIGLYEGDTLIATGALVGAVLQGIAVSSQIEGEGAAATIVSSLIKKAVNRGIQHLFLFSSAQEAQRFEALGFSLLASTAQAAVVSDFPEGANGASLLEWPAGGIDNWLNSLKPVVEGKPAGSGAVVVNCNPFTLGHRALIEYAASQSPWLYVLVVEEDRSLFPFNARFELVKKGTADIKNITVLKGGQYVISSATFPTYFIRPKNSEADKADIAVSLHAALDLILFRRYIAPALKVADRFVGTEPYCPTTSSYNKMMKKILPVAEGEGAPIRVHEIPRFEIEGAAVSASRVRDLVRSGNINAIRPLVPETTWQWLTSAEALPVIEKIQHSDSRH